MNVRPLDPDDAPAWHELMLEGTGAFPSAFLVSRDEVAEMDAERCRAALAPGTTYGVFSDAGELLGFAGLHVWALARVQHRADIGPFFVRARHQGSGAADRLMSALMAAAGAGGAAWLDLWVAEANARARGFYAKHGFTQIGRREDAVRIDGQGETDLLMTRHLAPTA